MARAGFQCLTPRGDDLCFFGGICQNATDGTQYCECPDGFEHDFVMFHNLNCALPSNFYFVWLVYTAILTIVALGFTIRSVYTNKRRVRIIAMQHCVQLVLAWLCNLALYFQNGYFEAYSVMACVSLVLATYQIYYTFQASVLLPLFSVEIKLQPSDKRRIHLVFAIIPTLSTIRIIIVHIALLVLCRHPDPDTFNLVFVINAIMAPFFAVVNVLLIRPHRNKLLQVIEKSIQGLQSSSNAGSSNTMVLMLMNYKMRLETIVRDFNASLIFCMWFFIPMSIVYLILGSAPFLWVIQAVSLHVTFVWTWQLNRAIGVYQRNQALLRNSASQITALVS